MDSSLQFELLMVHTAALSIHSRTPPLYPDVESEDETLILFQLLKALQPVIVMYEGNIYHQRADHYYEGSNYYPDPLING